MSSRDIRQTPSAPSAAASPCGHRSARAPQGRGSSSLVSMYQCTMVQIVLLMDCSYETRRAPCCIMSGLGFTACGQTKAGVAPPNRRERNLEKHSERTCACTPRSAAAPLRLSKLNADCIERERIERMIFAKILDAVVAIAQHAVPE